MNKNFIYAIIVDIVFLVLLLLTLTAGRLILGGYLAQASQFGDLEGYKQVNVDNIQEVDNALIQVEPIVNKAIISTYVIYFILLLFYTGFIGTSWLLLKDKIKRFRDLFKFKKYYLVFGVVSLIYFFVLHRILLKIVNILNIGIDLTFIELGLRDYILICLLILITLVISFFYLIFSTKGEIKVGFLRLRKKLFLKIFLFLVLFLFIFVFFLNFFNLFIHYLTGILGLFEWYNYLVLLILFVLIEFLRSKFLKIHTP